jgi:hypothetical protein
MINKVEISNLQTKRKKYVRYLKKDILLLGGILCKKPKIYYIY